MVATAAVIPIAEIWLPRRAVAGEVIRCSPSTKQTRGREIDDVNGAVERGHDRSFPFMSAAPVGWVRNMASIRSVTM